MADMRITDGKGVHFTFDNGITISVQIGRGNYCDNYDFPHYEVSRDNPLPASGTAELAVWTNDGWLKVGENDDVRGRVSVSEVFRFIDALRAIPDASSKQQQQDAIDAFDWQDAV